ncbi:MAG: ATP-binding protein [Myxococcota bacterium]
MSDEQDELIRLRRRVADLERDNDMLSRELLEMERIDRSLLRQHGTETAVLSQVLDVIASRLPEAKTAVALADHDERLLHFAVTRGLDEAVLGIPLEANAGPVGQTLRGGSPRSFPARRFHLAPELVGEVDSLTLVPMRVQGSSVENHEEEAAGIVLVATTADTQLLGDDLEFLRRVGVHSAVLLENTRLFYSLRRSEKTYRTMVERAHLGMALIEPDGHIHQTNGPMRELLGETATSSPAFIDYVAEEDRELVSAHLDEDAITISGAPEVTLIGPLGARRVRLSVTPIQERMDRNAGHLLIARDITDEVALADEREALARRVQQAEKLSAVGQFVAGIAHELNNPLTVVIGYTELLGAEESLNPRLEALVEQVLQHAQRCGRIVADLLTFSRQEQRRPEPVLLSDVVHEALAATRHKVRPSDVIKTDVTADAPPVFGSPHALCQLVTNIIANALDAVALQDTPGRVDVRLVQYEGDQYLSIKDNGPGITAPDRIFDPFYTTKPIGKGTGLGLSICYGIAKDHGGTLQAENASDGGARITLILPESLETSAPLPVLAPADHAVPPISSGDGRFRVLVVDDEPGILDLVSQALMSFCDLATAETVELGLAELESNPVDLVLTDLRLPAGMTGADFYEEIAVRWPQLTAHVAFMTGDTIGQGTQAFLDRVQRPCLQKPFKISQLISFVRAQLSAD